MYYKIENKECEIYKKLHELRIQEYQIEKDNEIAIAEKAGLKIADFLGYLSQQQFRRVPQYVGFKFTEPDKVDTKTWKQDLERKDFHIPNKRTKAGRDMDEFLLNGLNGSDYETVFDILGLPHLNKFTYPFIEIVGEIIVIFIGDNQEPKDANIIEITKREFNEIISTINDFYSLTSSTK